MLLRRMSQVSVKRVELVIAGLQCKDFLWFVCDIFDIPALTESHTILKEAITKKSQVSMDTFRRGGRAQPHSIAFGGVFTNFTEANSG